MTTRLRRYGLALLCVVVAALAREAVSPFIGFGIIYGFLPLGVWVSGRFGGLGPSVLALFLGVVLVFVLRYTEPKFYWSNLEFQASVVLYLVVGAIVCLLCHSEHNARASLLQQLAKRRASELRLQAIMDNATAVIYLKDLQGRFLMINKRFEELSRFTQQELIGKTDADILPRATAAKVQANDQQVADAGRAFEFEEVLSLSDGLHTYIAIKFPIFDPTGRITAVGGISTDITDRTRATEALKAEQDLLQRTIEVQDHDRQLMAYEIHDGLVQYAAGALLHLEGIQVQAKSEALAEQIEVVVGILRKTVEEGRRLISGIHATILDDCGVVAAVDELIKNEERAHVQIEFVKDEGLGRMAPKIEETLYRITQEALTNVYKHSQSNKVRVELCRRNDHVHLEVRDWGVGFKPPDNARNVHGLRGMTERARIAGGQCTVESARGGGTRVVADLPYVSRN